MGEGPMGKVLVTGSAGFIGSATVLRLLERGDTVVGIDNLDPYYDPALKRARLARHADHPRYTHVDGDIADRATIERVFREHRPDRVINLAAQAGVRHGAIDPYIYARTNVDGFLTILEGCRHHDVAHLVYASSSSVYGANLTLPFSAHHPTEHPLSLYAATKKAGEQMAHAYAHLYGIPATGLRFFTVYGPWGRPDMALFLFCRAILAGEPIPVYNHGRHRRSFTYIDDIVEGIVRVLDRPPAPDPLWDGRAPDPATSGRAPYRLFNIGSKEAVELSRYIALIEAELGREAILTLLPLQPGDVPEAQAEVDDLRDAAGYEPVVRVEEGVRRFVRWYRDFHRV